MSAKERRSSSRINASKSSKSSSRQEGLELFMECEDEELTPAQLEAAQQAEQEYQDAIHKINTLKSSNASVKDIATNQSTAAVQPQIFNASSSSPNLIGAPRVAAVTSQAQQQSQQYIAIPNAVPVQALQSPPPGYKLLVDTRTGLIIGTMPPEGQAIITTPPQTPAPQNPVSLVPVKQTSKTSVPQILNVTSVAPKTAPVPVSLSQAAVPHGRKSGAASIISKVNASTKPMLATSLLRVKRDEKPKTENAAISDVSPSSSKPAPQVQPVKKIITTYTPTIRPPNQYPSLNIKVVPQRQSSPGVFQQKRVDLDTTMKEILDQPMSKLVKWMFEHGLFHISQRCTIHRATQMQLILDTKNEKDRSGGYRWQCPVCDGVLPIQHRSFFDSLGYNFVFMLRLIYYWSCNEEILTVLRETQVDACFLRSVFALLRTICSNQIKSQIKLGGNDSKPVEFSIQLLKNSCSNAATVFIGCAYERGTGLIALRAFNSKLINKIENFLGDYIHTSSTLIVEKGLNLPATFINQHSYHIIPSSELDIQKCLILNAMAYVNERVAPMFGNTLMQMRIETVQTFLDELMWREKFGTNPYNTFNNILLHIKQHYGTGTANMKSGTSQPIQMPIVKVVTTSDSKDDNSSESSDTVSGNNIANQTPTRAFNANRKYTPMTNLTLMNPVKRQTSDETIQSQRNTVLLDNYYYAWKAGMDDLQGPVESNYKFKCHVCKKVLDNNIKIMRHLYAHIESSKQRNLDLSDLSQCKYCYREFETPFIMQCHVEDVHLKESNSLACRICEKAFQDKEKLIAHMYTTHTSAEMPYNCDVCKYRCSKYRTVIEHFEQAHNGSNHMQCHYCLRVFTIKCSPIQLIGMTSNFWNHIYKHQTKSLSRKCTACCLSFFSQPEMKNHRLNDHISFKDQPDVHTLEPPKSAESVYMLEPLRDHRGRIPRVKLLKACGSGTTTTQIRPMNQVQGQALVFESLLEVKIEGLEGMYCIECKSEMESAEHFKKYLGCSLCRFTTNCGKAYANHMISWHSQYPKKEVFGKEIHLPFRMYCLCGYSQIRGNLMAKHLVKCGKRSCYQDLEIGADSNNPYPSASFPPLVSLDEKSSDCNQPFSATVQDDSHTSTTLTEDKLQSDDQESNPSMLNILGLMRKPQKKTDVALPSGVRVQLSNEDSNLSNTSQSVDVSFEPGKESAEDSVDAELNRTKSPSEEHLDIECSNGSDSNADSTSAVSVSSGRKRSREVDDPDEDSNSSAIKRMRGGYLIEKIKEEPFDESEIGDLETDMLYPKVQLEEIKVKEEPIDGDEESAVPDGADSIKTNDKMEEDVDKNKQESSSKTLVKSNEDNVVSKDNSNAIADQVINVDCIKKETETESEVPEHCETSKDTSVTEKKANANDSAPVLANNNSSSSNNNNNNSNNNNNNNNDSSNNNNTTTTTTSNSSPNRNTVSVIAVQQETSRDTEEDSAPPILDCYAPESDS